MGKILSVKIQSGKNQQCQFKSKINMEDYKQGALLMQDLESFGMNVEKSFKEFKRKDLEKPWWM